MTTTGKQRTTGTDSNFQYSQPATTPGNNPVWNNSKNEEGAHNNWQRDTRVNHNNPQQLKTTWVTSSTTSHRAQHNILGKDEVQQINFVLGKQQTVLVLPEVYRFMDFSARQTTNIQTYSVQLGSTVVATLRQFMNQQPTISHISTGSTTNNQQPTTNNQQPTECGNQQPMDWADQQSQAGSSVGRLCSTTTSCGANIVVSNNKQL